MLGQTQTIRDAYRRGMTLIELMLCVLATAGAAGVLVQVSASLRADTAEQRTIELLRPMRAALLEYHARYQAYPTGDTQDVLRTLYSDRYTRRLLADVPMSRGVEVLDGFGRPIKFVEADHDSRRPADFVSAGEDGRFGKTQLDAEALDNLYASETELE